MLHLTWTFVWCVLMIVCLSGAWSWNDFVWFDGYICVLFVLRWDYSMYATDKCFIWNLLVRLLLLRMWSSIMYILFPDWLDVSCNALCAINKNQYYGCRNICRSMFGGFVLFDVPGLWLRIQKIIVFCFLIDNRTIQM